MAPSKAYPWSIERKGRGEGEGRGGGGLEEAGAGGRGVRGRVAWGREARDG